MPTRHPTRSASHEAMQIIPFAPKRVAVAAAVAAASAAFLLIARRRRGFGWPWLSRLVGAASDAEEGDSEEDGQLSPEAARERAEVVRAREVQRGRARRRPQVERGGVGAALDERGRHGLVARGARRVERRAATVERPELRAGREQERRDVGAATLRRHGV